MAHRAAAYFPSLGSMGNLGGPRSLPRRGSGCVFFSRPRRMRQRRIRGGGLSHLPTKPMLRTKLVYPFLSPTTVLHLSSLTPTLTPSNKALKAWWTGSIHRASESYNSRKLTLRIEQPYALAPGLWAILPQSNTPTSRHLDTPSHKNSLAVSESSSSRQFSEEGTECRPLIMA